MDPLMGEMKKEGRICNLTESPLAAVEADSQVPPNQSTPPLHITMTNPKCLSSTNLIVLKKLLTNKLGSYILANYQMVSRNHSNPVLSL